MRTIGGLGKSNNRELGAKNPSSSVGECDQLKLQRHTTTVQCMSKSRRRRKQKASDQQTDPTATAPVLQPRHVHVK